jgi:hypothetical protein
MILDSNCYWCGEKTPHVAKYKRVMSCLPYKQEFRGDCRHNFTCKTKEKTCLTCMLQFQIIDSVAEEVWMDKFGNSIDILDVEEDYEV